jgi:hypothetical protein
MKILACVLLLCSSAFAKDHAPLPDELLNAKTVYIVNQTGNQKATDTAYDQFSKWGKFKVVSNKDSADIVAAFTFFPQDDRFVVMQIFVKSSPDAAFQTMERWLPLSNGPKNCVGNFKKRLEQK